MTCNAHIQLIPIVVLAEYCNVAKYRSNKGIWLKISSKNLLKNGNDKIIAIRTILRIPSTRLYLYRFRNTIAKQKRAVL